MSKQIFKMNIDREILIKFLDNICDKNDNHYLLSNNKFKIARDNGNIVKFFNIIRPYYQESKRHYIDRIINYPKFITVIRQLCKQQNIAYTSEIQYSKSNYDIEYHIYV